MFVQERVHTPSRAVFCWENDVGSGCRVGLLACDCGFATQQGCVEPLTILHTLEWRKASVQSFNVCMYNGTYIHITYIHEIFRILSINSLAISSVVSDYIHKLLAPVLFAPLWRLATR